MKITALTKISSGLIISAVLCAPFARATPITGSINFDGVAKVDTGNLLTATAFTSITGVSVVPNESGNYFGTTGANASFSTFSFSALAATPLWSFTVGATSYSFDSTGPITVAQFSINGTSFLNLSGSGYANETGFDTTAGFWSITDTSAGKETTFVFGSDAAVPDNGATALLIALGIAGVGVGMIARRRGMARM